MKNIKLIACDIDGVLLKDTFSPVLRALTHKYGVLYTKDLENNTFSQRRSDAADYLRNHLKISETTTRNDILKEYFLERDKYLQDNESILIPGVQEFLEMLSSLDVVLVCYGGLEEEMIDSEFLPYLKYFDRYICTNSFRPGLKEITNSYGYTYSDVLFIDDVNRVAKEAKEKRIPFIGIPPRHSWGYQMEQMKETGVKYTVKSISEITRDYLEIIDTDNSIW